MADEVQDSRYKELTVPDFKSTIPAHLLGRLTDSERYLVETLSKMEQQNTFLIGAVLEHRLAIRDGDIRLGKVEKWKANLSSKWAVIAVILAIIVPVALKEIFDHWFP